MKSALLAQGLALSVVTLALSACGGGGGDSATTSANTSQGTFIDSAVSGMSYTCGSLSGTTDSNGRFSYTPGSSCTFKIGGVTVGTATASATLTPVSLVSGASNESNTTVGNIASFLQSLDTDNDPSNGIAISDAVKTTLATGTLDFTSNSFGINAQTLVTQAYSTRTLTSTSTAQAHLRSSILSKIAGTYRCTFSGSDNGSGTATLTSTGTSGSITGTGTSNIYGGPGSISGSYTSNGATAFTLGSANTGATFSGTFGLNGSASGTWSNTNVTPTESGSWSCSKS